MPTVLNHDPVSSKQLLMVGFTLVVFLAVLAVLSGTYAEVVLAVTLLAIIWQIVSVFGVSLLLATVLILLGLGLRVLVAILGNLLGIEIGTEVRARLLDDLITDQDRRNRDE